MIIEVFPPIGTETPFLNFYRASFWGDAIPSRKTAMPRRRVKQGCMRLAPSKKALKMRGDLNSYSNGRVLE